jgi:hypothetical protein
MGVRGVFRLVRGGRGEGEVPKARGVTEGGSRGVVDRMNEAGECQSRRCFPGFMLSPQQPPRNEAGGIDVRHHEARCQRNAYLISPFLQRLSMLPAELLQNIAEILVDNDKHRRCSRLNRTCRTIHQATVRTLWKIPVVTAPSDSKVRHMLKEERWKVFRSAVALKYCRYGLCVWDPLRI